MMDAVSTTTGGAAYGQGGTGDHYDVEGGYNKGHDHDSDSDGGRFDAEERWPVPFEINILKQVGRHFSLSTD